MTETTTIIVVTTTVVRATPAKTMGPALCPWRESLAARPFSLSASFALGLRGLGLACDGTDHGEATVERFDALDIAAEAGLRSP